jgi:hypothetical protein
MVDMKVAPNIVKISKNLAKGNMSYGQNGECLSAVFPK